MATTTVRPVLSKKQQEAIRNIARWPEQGYDVSFYTEDSLSGLSVTLRCRRDWVDRWQGRSYPRYQTSMVLSVTLPEWEPDDHTEYDAALAAFEAKRDAALALYQEERAKVKQGA